MAAPLPGHAWHPRLRGCVIDRGWNCCTTTRGGFVDGHVAAPEDQVDVDSWSHHLERGIHRALVNLYPRSGQLTR
ncbi:hypothetical protein [Streptomyces sp. NPDC088270]|uniref:hypothetical protein n=1 Tax=unclassified Streptomyces TaxID=2593676 RepID=UPI0034194748